MIRFNAKTKMEELDIENRGEGGIYFNMIR